MNTLRACAALGLALVFATGAEAQDHAAETILAAMRQASGGTAWDGVKALHYTMAVSVGGQQFRAEHWEDVATGRYRVREVLADHTAEDGFDGITPWRQGGSGIAYTLGDVDSALGAADEAFRVSRSWWFRDRHPATIALAGSRDENGRSFDILDITPQGGRPFEAWIDRKTHLLARTIEQQAEDRIVTDYSDYRPIRGLLLPFTLRSDDAVETVLSVDVNAAIPDSLYAVTPRPPSDIALPSHRDSIEVPFRLTGDNRILIPLTVDGRKTVEAEFDSGGSLILQPALLSAMHLATAAGQSRTSGGGEGSTLASKGRLASVAIGGAELRNAWFHSFAFDPADPDKALAGLEILQRFVVHFDFDRQIMTLTRPDAFVYRGGTVIPFHIQDNQPEIKGSIDGIAGLFAIDTGDNSSLLLIAPFARRYDLVAHYHADLPYGGSSVGATHGVWARKRAGTVTFDGPDGRPAVEVHDPVTRISLQHGGFDANREVSANIGLGILRQFNLTFDYPQRRLILTPSHYYGQKDVFNRSGMVLKRRGSQWSITGIYPGSPAADVGIQIGDVLTSINGKPASSFDRATLWALLKGPVGTKLQCRVRRAGTERHVTFALQDVL